MIKFLARRGVSAVPILIGVSVLVFIMIKIIPGDPVAALLGPTASPASRAALTHRLGLDHPWPVQYVTWLRHAITGDLGTSISKQEPVRPLVWTAFTNTMILAGAAALIAIVLGVVIGGIGAARPKGIAARISNGVSLLAVSLPQYSVALVFIVYLAVQTGWFPASGMHNAGTTGFPDLLSHLWLPAITAALVPAGVIARMFRSALGETLQQDFIESLRARGLSERRCLLHAVHNTLPTLLTVAGLQIGYLLGGVVFVETIFSWPGIGLLVYQAISTRDLPLIQAGVLISALAFVIVNVLVDAAHAAVDPRVRTA
jgi:peptide/nickel transport system permease protein